MPPLIMHLLRSRWFGLVIHAALWVLLYVAVIHLGGKAPLYQDAGPVSSPPQVVAPVAKLDAVFSANLAPIRQTNTPATSAFLTHHFVPPPKPAPPPPPTTRKFEVTYQGFYQAPNGPKFVVLKMQDGLKVVRIGGLVETNVFIADASFTNAILTNLTAQTNLLPLNAKKEIEVPIK